MTDATVPVVMIVGDDSEFTYLMQRYVSQRGCHVLVAHPNPGTVDTVRQEKPTAIVIDVEFPKAAGWDVLRMLRADQGTQDIPVVVCSWLDDEARSLEEGANAHLRKPVMYSDVLEALVEAGVPMGG